MKWRIERNFTQFLFALSVFPVTIYFYVYRFIKINIVKRITTVFSETYFPPLSCLCVSIFPWKLGGPQTWPLLPPLCRSWIQPWHLLYYNLFVTMTPQTCCSVFRIFIIFRYISYFFIRTYQVHERVRFESMIHFQYYFSIFINFYFFINTTLTLITTRMLYSKFINQRPHSIFFQYLKNQKYFFIEYWSWYIYKFSCKSIGCFVLLHFANV